MIPGRAWRFERKHGAFTCVGAPGFLSLGSTFFWMVKQWCKAVETVTFGHLQEFGREKENIINLVISKFLSDLGM